MDLALEILIILFIELPIIMLFYKKKKTRKCPWVRNND